MKFPAALCLLALVGCAAGPTVRMKEGSPSVSPSQELAETVRLETPAGTFLVSPESAEDFAKALAGQPTTQRYSADITF